MLTYIIFPSSFVMLSDYFWDLCTEIKIDASKGVHHILMASSLY